MKRMKYYHPEAHSFDTLPTNSNIPNVDLPAHDTLHPSDEFRNLRPKGVERLLGHEPTVENPQSPDRQWNLSSAVRGGRIPDNQPTIGRRSRAGGEIATIPNNLRETSVVETRRKRARRNDDEDDAEETKEQPVNKRGKLSCDQCYHRKIKVLCSMAPSANISVPPEGRL